MLFQFTKLQLFLRGIAYDEETAIEQVLVSSQGHKQLMALLKAV